jgi:toxin ParE1/3/4
MSRRYHVIWSPSAKRSLIELIDYFAATEPANAFTVLQRIRRQAEKLSRFPERGRIVPEFRAQGFTSFRELVLPPWRIIYRIADAQVYILAVVDSRRNPEDILLAIMTASQ